MLSQNMATLLNRKIYFLQVVHSMSFVGQVFTLKRGVDDLNIELFKYASCPNNCRVSLRSAMRYYHMLSSIRLDLNRVSGQDIFFTSSLACMDITYSFFASILGNTAYETLVCILYAVLALAPEVIIAFTCQQAENAVSFLQFVTDTTE